MSQVRRPRLPVRIRRAVLVLTAVAVLAAVGYAGSRTWVDTRPAGDETAVSSPDPRTGPQERPPAGAPIEALVEASTEAAVEGRAIPGDLEPPLRALKKDEADLGRCDYARKPPWRLCPRGDTDADRSIVLLGNSHGRHWIPAFERIAEHAGYTTYYFVKSACTPARVVSIERTGNGAWEECTAFNEWAEQRIREIRPELVVISGSAPRAVIVDGEPIGDTDRIVPLMRDGFAQAIEDVAPYAGKVAVLADVPRRQLEPADCLRAPDATLRSCLTTPKPSATRIVGASRAAARSQGVQFVETEPWFCAEGKCPAVVGGHITMRDNGHITTAYAERLGEPLGRELGVWDRGRD